MQVRLQVSQGMPLQALLGAGSSHRLIQMRRVEAHAIRVPCFPRWHRVNKCNAFDITRDAY